MCILCTEFAKGKLTVLEAFQNLSEMGDSINDDHLEEVIAMLSEEWEKQSFMNSSDETATRESSIDDVYDADDFDSPWDEYSEYGNFDDEI